MSQSKYMYGGFVETLSQRFTAVLDEIEVEHNFEYGNEFEIAICKTLRRVLPSKFGICRGYVVNQKGDLAGDDVIIYDRSRFPTLRLLDDSRFEQKERVPIEAAYAYIEAKHTLYLDDDSGQSLTKALKQIAAVKKVCQERHPLAPESIVPYVTLPPEFGVKYPDGWPNIQNPMFAGIISRHVVSSTSKDRVDAGTLSAALPDGWDNIESNPPDLIIAGPNVVGHPLLLEDSGAYDMIPIMTPGKTEFVVGDSAGIGFGVGLACLLYALDWINLRKMPWDQIIVDAMKDN